MPPTAHRVVRRFLDQRTARKVASRFVWAMSLQEARRILEIPKGEQPSDDEIRKLYSERIRKVIKDSPGARTDSEAFKELNIAKDTLLGQFESKRPGQPNAPEPDGVRRRDPRDDRRVDRDDDSPPPTPEGMPFSSALSSLGNVEWKILTTGHWGYDVLVDAQSDLVKMAEDAREDARRSVYFAYVGEYILIGRTDTHYVFAKLTRRRNVRNIGNKGEIIRWDSFKTAIPISENLVKRAPKVIEKLRGKTRGRPKFMVLEDKPTEERLEKFRGTLSLADAIAGSGILPEGADTSGVDGRKAQIEVEPVLNREKFKAWKADPTKRQFEHMGYDWYIYVNGRKTELSADEVMKLQKNHFLMAVFSYDYSKGKKNITRLKGGGRRSLKPGAKESLGMLADGLDSGPLRTTVEQAAEAAPEAK